MQPLFLSWCEFKMLQDKRESTYTTLYVSINWGNPFVHINWANIPLHVGWCIVQLCAAGTCKTNARTPRRDNPGIYRRGEAESLKWRGQEIKRSSCCVNMGIYEVWASTGEEAGPFVGQLCPQALLAPVLWICGRWESPGREGIPPDALLRANRLDHIHILNNMPTFCLSVFKFSTN